MAPSTLLPELLLEGGPIMPLILLTALVGYVIAIERLLAWAGWHFRNRRFFVAPDVSTLAALLRESPGDTPLADLLLQAQAVRHLPPERREPALQAALLARMPEVEARISTIGWLGTILPMLGLLGTVSGMITTFQDLAVTTSRQVLSQGLSEALWTTEVGLLGALPLLAVHHLLSRLKVRWINHLERAMALLLSAPPDCAASPPPSAPHPASAPATDEP